MAWEIINGDCLEEMRKIPDASVDAILTDPPYAIPTVVAMGRHTTINIGDLSLIESAFRQLFEEYFRLLKPTGRMFIFCDGTSYPVIFRAAYGKFNTALLVWDKGRIGMGREFRKRHELVLHGWKNDTPIVSDGIGYSDILSAKPVSSAERVHPAQKPEGLLTQLLRVCGDRVLDTFCGSGSTGIACIHAGKEFIGMDISSEYCDIARSRIAEAERQTAQKLP